MFDPNSEPRKMGKRGTLEVGGEKLRRLPIYEYPDGIREVRVPISRLRSFDTPDQLPEFATVTHSGYQYDAELVMDEEDAIYEFEVENY